MMVGTSKTSSEHLRNEKLLEPQCPPTEWPVLAARYPCLNTWMKPSFAVRVRALGTVVSSLSRAGEHARHSLIASRKKDRDMALSQQGQRMCVGMPKQSSPKIGAGCKSARLRIEHGCVAWIPWAAGIQDGPA